MTLVLAVSGRDSLWALVDRRLSYSGRPPRDDARKIMILSTGDALALLAYAGLGATAHGTEPADWMSAVLRGRNLPLEQSLGVLADAMKREFPPHLVRLPGPTGPSHTVIASAFVGAEARLYTIDMVFASDRKRYHFRYTRHVVELGTANQPRTPRIVLGGSGAPCLHGDQSWQRDLLRLVKGHDRGRVSADAVADYLATLNYRAHLGTQDRSVGPRCIVVWRYSERVSRKRGAAHRLYTDTRRESDAPSLPEISRGMDIPALITAMWPHMMKRAREALSGQTEGGIDDAAINADLARLPETPDEKLR